MAILDTSVIKMIRVEDEADIPAVGVVSGNVMIFAVAEQSWHFSNGLEVVTLKAEAAAAIAAVNTATVDGTYDADTALVINDLRTKLDAVLVALRANGIIATA